MSQQMITALQEARTPELVELLIDKVSRLTPQQRDQIITLLLTRNEWTSQLLDQMAEGRMAFTDLQLDQRQSLLNHPTGEIASAAAELMKSSGASLTSNRQELVNSWMEVTHQSGDVQNGITMFKTHCAQCHQHGELGVAIGPNLTGMAVHPKEELLVHILDPSRSVEGNFRTYQVLTLDGEVITGMLAGESQNALRLINAQGKEQQVLRENIDELIASSKSLMPEGFEALMNRQQMADLLAFMTRKGRYTPLSFGPAATASSGRGLFFDEENPAERILMDDWSPKTVAGVPFVLIDPAGGRQANLIMLRSENGRVAAKLPTQVRIPVSAQISAIHLLGGIAGWGYPAVREQSVSMIVRCVFADGSTRDYPLINGRHIADYVRQVDVPDSQFAFDASGRQVRYIRIDIDDPRPLQAIEFVKGEDSTAPIVFAVTVEAAKEQQQ